MTEREAAEHNAVAWLSLTDRELIERSASLGLAGNLFMPSYIEPEVAGGVPCSPEDVDRARKAADDVARGHAGDKFVSEWIKSNRQ